MTLAVLATHPIQYQAPIYRVLGDRWRIPVTAVYGSDFSLAGYRDREFGTTVSWDVDLAAGYDAVFLSRATAGSPGRPDAVSWRGMAAALRRLAPRALLLTGYSPRFHQVACLHALRSGYPVLFRGETTDHATRRGRLKSLARDVVLRWLYRRCTRLLYVGRRSYAHFRRLGCPEDKLVFSPYCVDTSPFQADETARDQLRHRQREAAGVPEHALLLLFSGKLVSRKGPELLVDAVRQLPSALRDRIVLGFLGDGELRGALERSAGASPVVPARLFGFHNQREVSSFYHAADLLVLPSREGESWGLVVNDASHHGLPAVVSDAVGSAPDLVIPGQTGETFPAGSARHLAAALERSLPLVGRADVRARCRAVAKDYGVEAAAHGIARAFFAATGRGR